MADEPKEPKRPKLELVKPKKEREPLEAKPTLKFESPADEWVHTAPSMAKLAEKWGVSRATLYRRRKREGWDKRRVEFLKLVEEKKRRLQAEERQRETETTSAPPDPTSPEIETPEDVEAVRAARVDEGAADKKARAEIVMHSIGYAMAAHLAKLMGKDHWAKVDLPTDALDAFKMARYGADFFEKVIGKPEPPPKPQTVFEVRIEPKGGAIQTIERWEDETLEQALERLDAEYRATKARLLEAFGGPPSPPHPPTSPGVPTIDGEPVQ